MALQRSGVRSPSAPPITGRLDRKASWYREAARNLGLCALIQFQLSKLLLKGRPAFSAHSKYLRHPVLIRNGTSDALVFDQIFIEREYRCLDRLDGLSLILDCGANVGYASAYFLSRFPDAFVIAVEPDAANFRMLQHNLAPYAGRFLAVHAALWSEPGELHFDAETLSNGLEWGRTVSIGSRTGSPVRAIDIDGLLAMADHPRVSLLKMDIEGAEEQVFAADHAWLDRVDNFVIEIHGPDCEAAVMNAVGGRPYTLSTCGELTVGIGPA